MFIRWSWTNLMFVYIYIVVRDPFMKKGRVWNPINSFNPASFFACPKPGQKNQEFKCNCIWPEASLWYEDFQICLKIWPSFLLGSSSGWSTFNICNGEWCDSGSCQPLIRYCLTCSCTEYAWDISCLTLRNQRSVYHLPIYFKPLSMGYFLLYN